MHPFFFLIVVSRKISSFALMCFIHASLQFTVQTQWACFPVKNAIEHAKRTTFGDRPSIFTRWSRMMMTWHKGNHVRQWYALGFSEECVILGSAYMLSVKLCLAAIVTKYLGKHLYRYITYMETTIPVQHEVQFPISDIWNVVIATSYIQALFLVCDILYLLYMYSRMRGIHDERPCSSMSIEDFFSSCPKKILCIS